LLLDFLFQAVRTEASQAFTVGDLKRKLSRPHQPIFAEMLDRKARTRALQKPWVMLFLLRENREQNSLLSDWHRPGRPGPCPEPCAEDSLSPAGGFV
jgi:hypothetical protein